MQKTTLQTTAKPSFTEFALINAKDILSRVNDASQFFHELSTYPQTKQALLELETTLGIKFNDQTWPLRALVHRSFMNDAKEKGICSNERLEFLGDSLIGALVSRQLYEQFSHLPEGDLSKLRAALVNENSFTQLAGVLKLEDLLIVGKGEWLGKNYVQGGALADGFEAMMAAVANDLGPEAMKTAFNNVIKALPHAYYDDSRLKDFDPKTTLQETTMALYKEAPTYEAVEVSNGLFVVALKLRGKQLLSLDGHSKKKTEKELARRVLAGNLHLEGDQHAH
tara:strand:- start:32929 stop:33771 length:843 start_codon:yes stop_codon:yes gene_type:complete